METEVQKFAEFVKRMDSDELRRIAKTMKEGIEEAEAGNIRLGKITGRCTQDSYARKAEKVTSSGGSRKRSS